MPSIQQTHSTAPNASAPSPASPGLSDSNRFSRFSYYSFDGVLADEEDPNSQTWMLASEVREQLAGVPDSQGRPYPSVFYYSKYLPLSTPGSQPKYTNSGRTWLHYPLIPGQSSTWKPYTGVRPGAVRIFFTAGDPYKFDVGYHDPRLRKIGQKNGPFVLATYHPEITRADSDPSGSSE